MWIPRHEEQGAVAHRQRRGPAPIHQTVLAKEVAARSLLYRSGVIRRVERELAGQLVPVHAHDDGLHASLAANIVGYPIDLPAEIAPAHWNELQAAAVAHPGQPQSEVMQPR